MKSGLWKKSGYSLKDTFITVIKCLVLTWAFFLIGINVNDNKVKAADKFSFSITAYDNLTIDGTNIYLEDYSEGVSYVKFKTTSLTVWNNHQNSVQMDALSTFGSLASANSADNVYSSNGVTQKEDGLAQKTIYITIVWYDNTKYSFCQNSTNLCGEVGVKGATASATNASLYYKGTSAVFDTFSRQATSVHYRPYDLTYEYLRITCSNAVGGGQSYEMRYYDRAKPTIDKFKAVGGVKDSMGVYYFNTTDVSVELSAYDNTSSSLLKYCIQDSSKSSNNCTWSDSGVVPTSYTATTTGLTHKISLHVKDNRGNIATSEISIHVDLWAPTVESFVVKSATTSAQTGYTNTTNLSFEILNPSDTSSGINQYQLHYSYNGGTEYYFDYYEKTAPTTVDFYNSSNSRGLSAQGRYKIVLKIFDLVSNCTTVSFDIIYDTEAPTVGTFEVKGSGDLGYTGTKSVKITKQPEITGDDIHSYNLVSIAPSGGGGTIHCESETAIALNYSFNLNIIEGTHIINYVVYDKAGNSGYSSYEIIYDKTSPTAGSLSCTGVCEAWTNQNVTVAASGGSDTNWKGYRYSYNGNYYWGNSYTFTENIEATIYFWAYDKAGNTKLVGSKTVKIDKTKPTVDDMDLVCESGNCNGWTKDNVVLNLSGASDTGGSELANYQYSYDQSTWSEDWDTGSTSSEVKGTWSADRNNTVYFRVYDNAGNYSDIFETSVNIMIDKQAPNPDKNITIINSSNGEWTNQNVTIVVSGAVDDKGPANANSGIAYYQFKYDTDSNWRPKSELGNGDGLYNESKGARDVWSAERDNTVSFRACDNAGNCTDYSKTTNIKIDRTPPTGMSVGCTSSCGEWTASDVTVSASSATDAGVGSFTYKYKIDSGSYTDGAAIKVSTNSGTIKQATVKYKVCDSLGNCSSEVEKTVKIDKSKPVISLKADGDHNFKITVTDTGSKATISGYTKKYYMSLSDNAFEEFASSSQSLTTDITSLTKIAGSGKYYIYVDISGIQDKVGNLPNFASTSSGAQRTVGSYKVQRFEVTMDSNPEKDPVNLLTDTNGNLLKVDGSNMYQIQSNKYLILTVNKGTNQTSLATLVSKLGLSLITKDDQTTKSKGYTNIIVKSKTENIYKVVTIAVVYNAPNIINSGTVASSYTIEQGEELDNFGLSFIGSDGSEVDVETLITLNGEKVSKLDTGVAGVYNVLQVAKDKLGRTTTIRREVIVEASVVEEEKSLEIEEVIEKQEIMMPIKAEEPAQTQTSVEEVKEVNTNKVEMRIEKKLKVRGYKKKKEIKRPSKESFTFKLFSKYFFKVYDG